MLPKAPCVGFLAVSVFILLAPTSLVPIAAEVGAERRMYLPLACIVTLVILGADFLWRRFVAPAEEPRAPAKSFLWTVGAIVLALAVVTTVRNREYSSGLTMARTILARPATRRLVTISASNSGRPAVSRRPSKRCSRSFEMSPARQSCHMRTA